jgi:hypothetical protein
VPKWVQNQAKDIGERRFENDESHKRRDDVGATARRSERIDGTGDRCGQAVKGAWWTPWHPEAMKDAGGRERPGRAANQAMTPGCPNGGTHTRPARDRVYPALNA